MLIKAAQLNRNLKEELKVKKKLVWLIVSCLMVTALVLASCAPAAVEEKEVKGVVKEPEKKVEEVEEVVEPETKYGGTLTVAMAVAPVSFDLFEAHWTMNDIAGYMYSSLIIGDWSTGRSIVDYRCVYAAAATEECWTGNLAESWERPDLQTIIFPLRKGVRWQNKPPVNGREFTADDVVWFYEAFLSHPRHATHTLQIIESVTATDKYTVVFRMKRPYIPIMRDLAFKAIAPREIVEQYGDMKDWRNLVGTGPFTLEDYLLDTSIEFKRNPDYFAKDPKGEALPYVDGVDILYVSDEPTRVAALRTGKIDLLAGKDSGVPWSNRPSLEKTNPELVWSDVPGSGPYQLHFKTSVEPLNNLKVRQALVMAINYQEIADTTFGGHARPFSWPAAPHWACYTPLEECPETIKEIYTWTPENPTKAKALLAEAGYPNGLKTSLQYVSTGNYAPYAEASELIVAYWDAIGVDLELKTVDSGTMGSLRYSPYPYEQMLMAGTAQNTMFQILDYRYRCDAPWNRSIVCDPLIDDTIKKVSVELDLDVRNELFRAANLHVLEQCYTVTFPPLTETFAWYPWLKGYNGEVSLATGFGEVAAHIWIDQEMRKKATGR